MLCNSRYFNLSSIVVKELLKPRLSDRSGWRVKMVTYSLLAAATYHNNNNKILDPLKNFILYFNQVVFSYTKFEHLYGYHYINLIFIKISNNNLTKCLSVYFRLKELI